MLGGVVSSRCRLTHFQSPSPPSPRSAPENKDLRVSERVPFPASYQQLALAHARNSRVKRDLPQSPPPQKFNCPSLLHNSKMSFVPERNEFHPRLQAR